LLIEKVTDVNKIYRYGNIVTLL